MLSSNQFAFSGFRVSDGRALALTGLFLQSARFAFTFTGPTHFVKEFVLREA